ncbi:DUF2510 domain-containing protein, partial [Streptomyces sp. Agncl-13]|uniref:DUF2510 domain-containing protein n=1 Tax=Streptomyces sp. Agncl-13 TaxID=3400628 RepID=UPI003A835E8E
MSAPTPAPGDDRPREGYYPDPSIPGYVRYWNGAAWVPGTSRPAPSDGLPLGAPGGPGQSGQPGRSGQSVEETGPHFFDEDPAPDNRVNPAEAQHGSRPEPAAAWGADRAHQSGFGGDQDRRVSWGSPDPRTGRAEHHDGGDGFEAVRQRGAGRSRRSVRRRTPGDTCRHAVSRRRPAWPASRSRLAARRSRSGTGHVGARAALSG